jgi:dTDP-4-dehydrorhamnose reductase
MLVTGGSGYLGGELLRRAEALGWEAVGTHLTHATTKVALDVRDAGGVAQLVAEIAPAAVVHTAYRQGGESMRAVNVDGARHVAAAAVRAGARFVHLSTDFVFDGEGRRPYREDDATRPVSEYGLSKLDAERAVIGVACAALIVRTSLIYGGETPSPHERMVADALAGEREVTFFEDEYRSPVAVGDLAGALLELCDSDAAGVLHVAGPEPVTRLAFARAIAAAAGDDPDRLRAGRSADQPVRRPRYCALDSSRAYGMLRTRVRSVGEVLVASPPRVSHRDGA